MRQIFRTAVLAGGVVAASVAPAIAQRPGGGGLTKEADAADLVARMMVFDANKDGAHTRAEVTDDRLVRLFDRADADRDGTVTRAELVAIAAKEHVDDRGGFGGPGGPPPGGFGGPGGGMRPGEVLPMMVRRRLGLSEAQSEQVDALQKQVDADLAKILNAAQRGQLAEMRSRGPGRFDPPGGPPPGGFGGPGVPPPGDR